MNALITGGSRGIGAAIARRLAADGCNIVIAYRGSAEKAAAVADECRTCGVKSQAVQADISREDDCRRLAQSARDAFGPIGILVNNAGCTQDGFAIRMSLKQFSEVLDTNLTGTFLMCRAVLPDMIKARQGRIVNLTSVAGLYGNAGQVNYASAKAGIIGLTRSLAKEMASRQITVNAIAPGFIETDMTSQLAGPIREKALNAIGLGRFGQPEDIAGAVAFLVSPAAGYMTGQVLEIS
ncbi:MAG TPA: 3-oxoacyl-[acyl-carrier-protein] reductase, partial [Clostridiales bacterium]|nr:3-oxoacyl-[acyl-carrier-protein] reductase [Clostridiales bacterium]